MSGTPITRREALKQSAALLAMLCADTAGAEPGRQEPARADWPMANGPDGNFNPRRYGHALVDDLSRARLVWKSEDNDIGFAKGSASGYLALLVKRPAHPGSCSGPVVAEGKVFCSSFRPAGQVWAENLPHPNNLKQPYEGKDLEKLRKELRIDADDLVLAVDQRTGKTAWKAVEKGKGLNRYMGKREGFGVAPACFRGRVFSMGTSGRLYAYEAASGKKLWEGDIGKAHQAAEAHKKKCLAGKTLPGGMGWDASLIVAGGVLIVPLFGGPLDGGLRGVDVDTGKTRWEPAAVSSRYATPGLFRHEGREYVLAATVKGELRLIDPREGKVLRWAGSAPTTSPWADFRKIDDKVHLYLPPNVETVRGVFVCYVFHSGDPRELARLWRFTLVTVPWPFEYDLGHNDKRNGRYKLGHPVGNMGLLLRYLDHAARETKHPERAVAPLVGWLGQNGSHLCNDLYQRAPDRVIAWADSFANRLAKYPELTAKVPFA